MQKEIYHEGLAYPILEAEKSRKLHAACTQGPLRAGGIFPTQIKRSDNQSSPVVIEIPILVQRPQNQQTSDQGQKMDAPAQQIANECFFNLLSI